MRTLLEGNVAVADFAGACSGRHAQTWPLPLLLDAREQRTTVLAESLAEQRQLVVRSRAEKRRNRIRRENRLDALDRLLPTASYTVDDASIARRWGDDR